MSTQVTSNYHIHDGAYQRLRAKGALGWDPVQEGYLDMMTHVQLALVQTGRDFPQAILEIGCGAGNLSVLMAKDGNIVTGVDISQTAVTWATERGFMNEANATFRVDDVVTLSTVADASFDVVVDGHCLHCIVGDDRAKCIESVRRVLKPGGLFVVMTMCGAMKDSARMGSFDADGNAIVDGFAVRHVGDPERIKQEIVAGGFKLESTSIVPAETDDAAATLVVFATAI